MAISFLQYLIAAIVSYLGIIGGFALAHIAPEELKPGKIYLNALKDILFFLIIIFIFYLKQPVLGLAVVAIIFIYIKFGKIRTYGLIYAVLGIVFALLSRYDYIFMIVASLVFMFGLPVGSLLVFGIQNSSKKRQLKRILASSFTFFITALPLYFFNF